MITRIAPTPSGFMHAGNVYNFLLNWLWARNNNGKVLLRIDDADTQRKRPEYLEDIFRVLEWLGMDWDIGPDGPGDFEKHWSQVHRYIHYNTLLDELVVKDLLFVCECSRTNNPADCNCVDKKIDLSKSGVAWRIKVTPDAVMKFKDGLNGNVSIDLSIEKGSFVVKRKDGIPAYQLTSLADDIHFRVTHIGRGEDLLLSTSMQLYIDSLLSQPYLNLCTFWHHPLLHTPEGKKFSKSAGMHSVSMIHSLNKQIILNEFAGWIGVNTSKNIQLKDMLSLPVFSL